MYYGNYIVFYTNKDRLETIRRSLFAYYCSNQIYFNNLTNDPIYNLIRRFNVTKTLSTNVGIR